MARMIFSCSTCCFRNRGRDEIEETLLYGPIAGYSYIALGGPFTWDAGLIQWLDKKQLGERLSAKGLQLSEISTPPIPTDSPEGAEIGAEQIAIAGKVSRKLGCEILVQTGGRRREGGIENTIHGLRSLMTYIKSSDIRVCLEPHVGSQILTVEDYDQILGEVKSNQLGITIDTGHFHSAGVDFVSLIRKYPHLIWNVHLKDHVGKQSVPIGTGEIDIPNLIQELKRVDYVGFLTVELEVSDPENAPEYVLDAHRYLSRLLEDK